ncbi:MAG: gliding motility-associated C-terminal domain-containing protein [Flavitalea sp.]
MKMFATLGLCLFFFIEHVKADHITGGEMSYTLLSSAEGKNRYDVTLKLFMRCNSGRQFNDPLIIAVFDRRALTRIMDISVKLGSSETLNLTDVSPCITNPPKVCYVVGYYDTEVVLPSNEGGYTLAAQVVYRIEGISNLVPNYQNVGATYTAEIPGIGEVASGPQNNSAKFFGNDMVIVCSKNSFSYSFEARDADGDELRFSFCNAYQGGFGGFGNNSNPPQAPPYPSVPYSSSFQGTTPLGANVKIDQATGVITGIAPADGIYVLTVCVSEIRNGIIIAVQRKDIQINISGCSIASASIPDEYMLCGDTRSIGVTNYSSSPLISSYNWDFMNDAGDVLYSADTRSANYTFPREGDYSIKLTVNRNGLCSDSTVSTVKVYPGFVPDFNFAGLCYNKPTNFTDASTTVFGSVNQWSWNFEGINSSPFAAPDTAYTYTNAGVKNVRLIVGTDLGCKDTITKAVSIIDKPVIDLAFRDTLICLPDNIRLLANGRGNFSWSPGINIIGANTISPTVSPVATTKYYVDLEDNGCFNRDSVTINVVDHVSLTAMADTLICAGDTVQLMTMTDGLIFSWAPSAQLSRNDVQQPFAVTPLSTLYQLTARIGSCSATDDVRVTAVPYPVANAGTDTLICFNTSALLKGSINGSSFTWSPSTATGNHGGIGLNMMVKPAATTAYILAAYDSRGCPKPGYDTVLVNVLPDIFPFAGNDTAVVVGQSLQLHATGGIRYAWSPAEGISDYTLADPKAVLNTASSGIKYKALVYNEAGCVDSAFVTVKVFNTLPSIFVPNAFTPNGDGKNDELKFIAAGIEHIDYFQVYNRYGQMVFNSFSDNHLWNGMVGGLNQPSGTYVWMIKAVDYNGGSYFRKGTVTLIR